MSPESGRQLNRILIKMSGEMLAGDQKYGHSADVIRYIASEIASLYNAGVQVCIVIGGGNIVRGEQFASLGISRANADYMGMLGTVINAIALTDGIEQLGVPVRNQSAINVQAVAEPFIRRRALSHLEKNRVLIFAAGTGNPFFTTDTAAALRATEMNCSWLFKATKVDGVYNKDPEKFPDAVKLDTVTYAEALSNPDIRVMDKTAITLCQEHRMPIRVFHLMKPGNILRAIHNEPVGTVVMESPDES